MASKDERFAIHNVSRSRANRTVRAQARDHRGLKQFIGGTHRLIRGEPLYFTGEQIELHLKELQDKESQGMIEIRTMDGRVMSLRDPSAEPRPLPKTPPLPHPVLDSIANDQQNVGQAVPQFPGGDAHMEADPNKVPDLVAAAEVEEIPPPPAMPVDEWAPTEPAEPLDAPHKKTKKGHK